MNSHRLIFNLNQLASLLRRCAGPRLLLDAESQPLDPVERLHRTGSTFPVVMELSRLGW